MRVSVKSDIAAFRRQLRRDQRRQIPFAVSRAINETAFDVRRRIIGPTWARAFTVRNRRFPAAAFRVAKATKRHLTASVFDRLGRASLDLHATGGIKRPRGRHIAVPRGAIKRTATGKVGKARRPAAVLARANVFRRRLGAREYILQRTRKGLRPLYLLISRARIAKRFRFAEDARRVVERRFRRRLFVSLGKALRTAR